MLLISKLAGAVLAGGALAACCLAAAPSGAAGRTGGTAGVIAGESEGGRCMGL